MNKKPYVDYEDDESVLPIGCDRRWHRLDQATMRQNMYNRNKRKRYGRTEEP